MGEGSKRHRIYQFQCLWHGALFSPWLGTLCFLTARGQLCYPQAATQLIWDRVLLLPYLPRAKKKSLPIRAEQSALASKLLLEVHMIVTTNMIKSVLNSKPDCYKINSLGASGKQLSLYQRNDDCVYVCVWGGG